MKMFNVGALRPATDDARAAQITAANDLVRRTLAQHGLSSDGGPVGAMPAATRISLDGLLARFNLPQGMPPATAPVSLPEGAEFTRDTFTCDAGSRAYRTYIPASVTASETEGATGVVVMLHGCTQNPEDFAAGTGMNALAEQHRFIVVYPAQSRGDNAQSCWNWFSRGDQRRDRGEPAILAGMTRKVCAAHGIDQSRTFVAGLSAGAAMAVILGETYPDIFAAVGAHSGLPYGTARDVPSAFAAMAGNGAANGLDAPPRPQDGPTVRTIIFHGTADATVHPSNGDGIARQALDKGARQTFETTEQGETAGRGYARRISTAPDGTPTLEHWTVTGLGHAWSGGQRSGSYTDPKGPDASTEMVRFFFETQGEEA